MSLSNEDRTRLVNLYDSKYAKIRGSLGEYILHKNGGIIVKDGGINQMKNQLNHLLNSFNQANLLTLPDNIKEVYLFNYVETEWPTPTFAFSKMEFTDNAINQMEEGQSVFLDKDNMDTKKIGTVYDFSPAKVLFASSPITISVLEQLLEMIQKGINASSN